MVKLLIYIQMLFLFSTPVLIRNLWQVKTAVFRHWCLTIPWQAEWKCIGRCRNAWALCTMHSWSSISNGREPISCFDRIFNSKLFSFVSNKYNCMAYTQPLVKLKTRPRFLPISRCLSMMHYSYSYQCLCPSLRT